MTDSGSLRISRGDAIDESDHAAETLGLAEKDSLPLSRVSWLFDATFGGFTTTRVSHVNAEPIAETIMQVLVGGVLLIAVLVLVVVAALVLVFLILIVLVAVVPVAFGPSSTFHNGIIWGR